MATLPVTPSQSMDIRIAVDRSHVEMGRNVVLTAEARDDAKSALVGALALPYVDGKRWGAHERTDAEGRVRWLLPMPNPGRHEIRVPPVGQPPRLGRAESLHGLPDRADRI